jgi:hypothetical protein
MGNAFFDVRIHRGDEYKQASSVPASLIQSKLAADGPRYKPCKLSLFREEVDHRGGFQAPLCGLAVASHSRAWVSFSSVE